MIIEKLKYSLIVLFISGVANAADFTIGLHPKFSLPGVDKEVARAQLLKVTNDISEVVNVNFKYHPQPRILIRSKDFNRHYAGWCGGKKVTLNSNLNWTPERVYRVGLHEV